MDYVSLIVLIAVIAVAFIFKVNTGLAAILASLALVCGVGLGEKFLISAFDSKMLFDALWRDVSVLHRPGK